MKTYRVVMHDPTAEYLIQAEDEEMLLSCDVLKQGLTKQQAEKYLQHYIKLQDEKIATDKKRQQIFEGWQRIANTAEIKIAQIGQIFQNEYRFIQLDDKAIEEWKIWVVKMNLQHIIRDIKKLYAVSKQELIKNKRKPPTKPPTK